MRELLQDTEKNMDSAVQCLYIAVDKSIADDVFTRWIAYKAAQRQRIAELEVISGRALKLEEQIREVCGIELNVLSNMGISFVEKAVRWYQQRIAELEAEVKDALECVYIPGVWACNQCKFQLIASNLYVQDGTIGPDTDTVPLCPNDDTLMRRVTWKERVSGLDKYAGERLNEIDTLKAEVARLTAMQLAHDDEQRQTIEAQAQRIKELESEKSQDDELYLQAFELLQFVQDAEPSTGRSRRYLTLVERIKRAIEMNKELEAALERHQEEP